MNTYLLPVSDGDDCWIEKTLAKGVLEAEDKFINKLAEVYEFIDYGDTFDSVKATAYDNGLIIGEIYDIEEF